MIGTCVQHIHTISYAHTALDSLLIDTHTTSVFFSLPLSLCFSHTLSFSLTFQPLRFAPSTDDDDLKPICTHETFTLGSTTKYYYYYYHFQSILLFTTKRVVPHKMHECKEVVRSIYELLLYTLIVVLRLFMAHSDQMLSSAKSTADLCRFYSYFSSTNNDPPLTLPQQMQPILMSPNAGEEFQ